MNKKNTERMKRYARLTLEKGAALIPGKSLMIRCEPESYEKARIIAETAYEMGAAYVDFEIRDQKLQALRTRVQKLEHLTSFPAYETAKILERTAADWTFVAISTTESNFYMDNADTEKNAAFVKARTLMGKIFSQQTSLHNLAWVVICVPGDNWAKEILGPQADEDDLWEVLTPILHLDDPSPSQSWKAVADVLMERRKILTEAKIRSLHYKSPVTDLTLGLNENAVWKGGIQILPDGRCFLPNIPTAETYTAPDMFRADGYVTTTKPVNVMGIYTEKVRLEFKLGSVVGFTAEKGSEAIAKFLDTDEGCRRIGEVSFVGEDSPIAKSGLIFKSILYDENASCHLALGNAYPDTLSNGKQLLTEEDKHRFGMNTSLMHVDFMVGSENLDICAETYDGKAMEIMKKGLLVF